ncbi:MULTISPECIES: NUDIX hydrolase [Shewanella]|jgi:8-oxo-dGTP pyrophosphatase MutT (NUDIX family)|uniref:8-oxo-dGTP diphosphatase n=1 Tax=Shewanella chilikensis TaxID=558541 RepID=A0A6G7LU55_9GAMM|nr:MULTISPECIES: NUDIX domain-containing protein [Shewanella]MBZ4680243.1 hydrolase [Shewanella sp.]MCA0949229.1 NUDIX domain-containing protein [Shewanella chilikensis]MCE9853033.1 NUDIX domain-containing protein [Shewanella chilikensis]MCL1161309.1 NUDIX domain-containing protein [Shewanella chilikensis]QIJ05353.1 NUDIX domain-containing protein [Shewanella chilikensis]
MKQLHSVAWLHKKNAEVLCVKSKGKDKFFIPGGKPEPGETLEQALTRELQEELSIELQQDTICHRFSITDKAFGLEDTELTMHCFSAGFSGDINTAAEIESLDWIGIADMAKCAPAAQQAIVKLLGSDH